MREQSESYLQIEEKSWKHRHKLNELDLKEGTNDFKKKEWEQEFIKSGVKSCRNF